MHSMYYPLEQEMSSTSAWRCVTVQHSSGFI